MQFLLHKDQVIFQLHYCTFTSESKKITICINNSSGQLPALSQASIFNGCTRLHLGKHLLGTTSEELFNVAVTHPQVLGWSMVRFLQMLCATISL